MIDGLERRLLLAAKLLAGGNLSINGTNDADTITVRASPDGTKIVVVTASGTRPVVTQSFPAAKVKQIIADGKAGNDSIVIKVNVPSELVGGPGNDRLVGGPANDDLVGEAGNDNLKGGGGNDLLSGGAGIDTCDGGPGSDVLDENLKGTVFFQANGFGPSVGVFTERFSSIERAILIGSAGADSIDAFLFGQTGRPVTIKGGAGADHLFGGIGPDRLEGGAGNDILEGFGGPDILIGGPDVDQAFGGAETDTCTAETQLNCE